MATDPHSDDGAEARHETRAERFDRNWGDILQELRAVQTGTQIISGFLLAAAFQPRFTELEPYQLTLYLVLVVLAATATLLGLGPVILHRRLFARLQKERIVRIGSGLLLADLVVVSLLAAGVTSLIFDVALGRTAGFVALVLVLVAVVVLWVVVPRISAERG
jgi:uncharacterized protein DUF6328